MALDSEARVLGTRSVGLSESVVLVGIPASEVRSLICGSVSRDIAAETAGTTEDLDIISGATVIPTIDVSVERKWVLVVLATERRPPRLRWGWPTSQGG